MSEITIARMQADLEAIRIAELYSAHPLLRHMPVPRFRLPEVKVELPVVIERMDEPRRGESARGGLGAKQLRKAFEAALASQLRANRIRLTAEQRAELNKALDGEIVNLEQPTEIAVDTTWIADRLSDSAIASLASSLGDDRVQSLATTLRETARRSLLMAQPMPPRLHVLVTTKDIRESGPIEAVTHIRVTISEESLELTSVEVDGEGQTRLVPE